jgi:hypothetical protein
MDRCCASLVIILPVCCAAAHQAQANARPLSSRTETGRNGRIFLIPPDGCRYYRSKQDLFVHLLRLSEYCQGERESTSAQAIRHDKLRRSRQLYSVCAHCHKSPAFMRSQRRRTAIAPSVPHFCVVAKPNAPAEFVECVRREKQPALPMGDTVSGRIFRDIPKYIVRRRIRGAAFERALAGR